MSATTATVLHGFMEFVLLAFAGHLFGRHMGLYGFRQGFVEAENRGRMYMTLAAVTLGGLWSEIFPAAKGISSVGQALMLVAVAVVFVRSFRHARGITSAPWPGARAVGQFAIAKANYERVMREKGYWFENRTKPEHYSDDRSSALLNESRAILENLETQLKTSGDLHDWTRHLVGLYWQLASVYCVLGRYEEAVSSLDKMRDGMEQVPAKKSTSREMDEYRSKRLFLSGELLYLKGNYDQAKQCFLDSRSVDQRLGDGTGVSMNDLRLRLFK